MQDDVPIFDSPEELAAHVARQNSKQDMEADASRHALALLFEELTRDQLMSMKHLMQYLQQSGAMGATFYAGYVTSELQRRFGVCSACGVSHHEAAEA